MNKKNIKIQQFTNSENLLHIGFGKAASSLLQKKIFPSIAGFKDTKFKIWNQDKLIDKGIYSSELLLNWNPEYWKESIKEIKRISNNQTHILLIIRNPKSYLSSIYAHACMRELLLYKSLNSFFLNKKEYELINNNKQFHNKLYFNVEKFSYQELIEMLNLNFERFTIVKFEKLFNTDFLKYFFYLNDNQNKKILNFTSTIYNVGITNFAANFTSIISIFYQFFYYNFVKKLKYKKNIDKKICYNDLGNNTTQFSNNIILKILIKKINMIYTYIFKFVFGCYPPLWKNFMIYRLNLFPSSRYVINFNKYPKFNIDSLCKEYNSLPDFFSKNDYVKK